jgi:2'-5' RNA ligase
MRLFIATSISCLYIKSYVKYISELNKPSNLNIKLIKNKNIHLTLHFLGETKENKIPKLITNTKSNITIIHYNILQCYKFLEL